MNEVAPNLVIEVNGVQHYKTNDGALMVYHPEYGSMHVSKRLGSDWSMKHAYGMLPTGFFFETISSGGTVAQALERATNFHMSEELNEFGKQVEEWYATDPPPLPLNKSGICGKYPPF